jgi:propionyl-CoA synthetase
VSWQAAVRPSGGHAVALHWSMKNVYGMDPGDVWWAASDLGWVVGHSYICYAPLLHGNTTIIYEVTFLFVCLFVCLFVFCFAQLL